MKYRLLLAVLMAGLMGLPLGNAARAEKDKTNTYELLNLFGDVFERLRADYVDEPTDQELIEAAINGMLTSLDPHSSFL